MKRLTLIRKWYEAERTLGELHIGSEFIAFTMEPGNADTDHPRVPVGFYHLVRHDDHAFRWKDTWALVGRDVSHQPEPDVPRFAVLFHPGNTDEQTEGCILLGKTIGRIRDETATVASGDALDVLRSILGEAEAYLTIKGG